MTSKLTGFVRPRPFDLNRVFTNVNQRYSLGANYGRRRLEDMPRRTGSNNRRRIVRAAGRRMARGRVRTLYKRNYSKNQTGILGGTNADVKYVYSKKSMPKYKRKRWAAFVRKVNAVDERDLGTRTVLFNDQIVQANTGATSQSTLTLALYPFKSSSGWLDDLNQIGQLENEGNSTAVAGGTIERNSKVMFHSAIMDVTIRNISKKYGTGGALANAPEAAIELDVYDIIARTNLSDNTIIWNHLSVALNAYQEQKIGGTGTGISIGDRGASPFECGAAISRIKMKILRKTKYFIPQGQTITMQVRNPKRKEIRYGDLETQESPNRPGWTTFKFLVYKLVPGLTQGTAEGDYKCEVVVGSTRKYMYKVEGFNEPRERLLGASYGPLGPNN